MPDDPEVPPEFIEAARHLAASMSTMADTLVRLEAQNLMLTAALAHTITFQSLLHPSPRETAANILAGAKAGADFIQKDLRSPAAFIDGTHETMALLRKLTTEGAAMAEEERKNQRRWWLPQTWGW